MSRRRTYRVAASILALLAMLFSSTVTAWALTCGDECDMAGMPCCPGTDGADALDPERDEARERTTTIHALGCCPARSTACAGTVRFDPGHAQSAHNRADDVSRISDARDSDAGDSLLASLLAATLVPRATSSPTGNPPTTSPSTAELAARSDSSAHLETIVLLL